MKTFRQIAVSIAVILTYSSMNVLASHSFDATNKTAASTPSFVEGQLGKHHTRLIQTINGAKSMRGENKRSHQRSIRRINRFKP